MEINQNLFRNSQALQQSSAFFINGSCPSIYKQIKSTTGIMELTDKIYLLKHHQITVCAVRSVLINSRCSSREIPFK